MRALFFVCLFFAFPLAAEVKVGGDVLLEEKRFSSLLEGKRLGLITNHTAVNSGYKTTLSLLKEYNVVALFTPEHGFYGDVHADDKVGDTTFEGITVYSLYGKTRRPTSEMLKDIDLLIYDIQDIGSRSYTFTSTLFYFMEEAANSISPSPCSTAPTQSMG